MVKQQLDELLLRYPPITISVHRLKQPLNRLRSVLGIIEEHLNLLNSNESTVIDIKEVERIL